LFCGSRINPPLGHKALHASLVTGVAQNSIVFEVVQDLNVAMCTARSGVGWRRKRRLIKGPEEFQEVRVDRPKAKGK
jgi:hypothetical protein